ncbi:MAG: glycosyltransferase family 39 protein [Thermoleophilia bacterium]
MSANQLSPPGEKGASNPYLFGLLVFFTLLFTAIAGYWSILNNTLLGDDFSELNRLYQLPVSELWRLFEVCVPTFVRPVPFFLYWFHYRFFGLDGWPSHLINVVFHAGSAFFLYWLLTRLSISRLASFMAALLFVLSPLAPEAVTWSDGRFDVTVLFFMMLTLCLYTLTFQKKSRLAYSAALLAAAAAFLSKESAIILLVLVPALDLMFVEFPPGVTPIENEENFGIKRRVARSLVRVSPFFLLIGFLFVLRIIILGGMGGYKEVQRFGFPKLGAPVHTIIAMMAPLDQLLTSRNTIYVMAVIVGIFYLIGLVLVVTRWKQASGQAKRIILLMILLFITSIMPTYSSFFIDGMGSYFVNSRFFYVPNLAFITLLVIALFEFGRQTRNWRIIVTVALALLVPVYFWGLNNNNRIWEKAAVISYNITTDLPRQVPDPPQDAIFYFQNAPDGQGAHWFANGLPGTVNMVYTRQDIKTFYLNPEPKYRISSRTAVYGNPPTDGYIFSYDRDTGHMILVQEPASP